MNEMNMKGASMYDTVEQIRSLNKVEGFDPRSYMRVITGEGETTRFYLDVAYRKLWFRLKYPEGKISKRLLKLDHDMAVIEARVYLHHNDAEENYVANAFSHKFRSDEGQFAGKFVELAETAAIGRALADAGFGLQFADWEKELDPEVTDAPFDAQILQGAEPIQDSSRADKMDEVGTVIDEDNLPGQHQIEEYIPMSQSPQSFPNTAPPAMQRAAASAAQMPQTGTPSGNSMSPQQSAAQIDKRLPEDKIIPLLTPEIAAAVVVNVGVSKGKTLGQIAVEKPKSLDWYAYQYNGPDNLLRTAAKYLLGAALQQAG